VLTGWAAALPMWWRQSGDRLHIWLGAVFAFRTAGQNRRLYAARLDEAVMQEPDTGAMRAMRGSVYLVPRELASHALMLTRMPSVEIYAKRAGLSIRALTALMDRIEQLVVRKPGTAAEIREALGVKAPNGSALTEVLTRMGSEGRIVEPPYVVGLAARVTSMRDGQLIVLPEQRPSRSEALGELAALWLAANGPATVADLSWWAGVQDGRRRRHCTPQSAVHND